MIDENARILQQQVASYLASAEGRTLDIGVPAHLALLVQHARADVKNESETEVWMTVAMSWLGPPPKVGPPPVSMREELHHILQTMVLDERQRPGRVMEFTIAYGCGKWREISPGAGGWEHRWQGAMRGLVRAMEPAVAQANRWLAAHVVGFPKEQVNAQPEGFTNNTADWSDAWLLGIRFVRPEKAFALQDGEELTLECTTKGMELAAAQGYRFCIPPGAKALWTIQKCADAVMLPRGQTLPLPESATFLVIARDDDAILKITATDQEQQTRLRIEEEAAISGPATMDIRECTCGTTHCTERHRLTSWNPQQRVQKADANANAAKTEGFLTLWDCLASAVKGPQASVKTGAFVQGMYFPLLAQEGLPS